MNQYSKDEPYISHIKKRTLLSKAGSTKKSYLLILDINGSDIDYQAGDSVAILPQNDPRIVDLTINNMKASPTEEVIDPKTKEQTTLLEYLTKKANITKLSPNLVKILSKNVSTEELKELVTSHHVWDFLKKHPKHKLSAQEIVDTLMPLLPRLYSAASSLNMYPNEIHLIITHVSYEISGIKRNGVSTEYLCHLAKVLKSPIGVYIQPSHGFNLPKDTKAPIIMIRAGCDVAPYRAFLEERYISKQEGPSWLIFGERSSKTDFYFEDFFKDLEDKNLLRLSTAFSRDQEYKIYVQDRLYENASDIWQWIQKGAYIYVCGDANMGKEVYNKILQIFQEEGGFSPEDAQEHYKKLVNEKRYLKDVY